jgi:hypothetical protein
MAAFVDGDVNMIHRPEKVDLGPLVGKRRGFRTKERVPYSGGLSGMEMYDTEHEEPQQHPVVIVSPASPAPEIPPAKITRIQCPATPNDRPPDPPEQEPELPMLPCEDRMPPKMRKKWIHRELEALRESSARCLDSPPVGLGIRVEMDVDGACCFVLSTTLLTSIYRFHFYATTACTVGSDTGSVHYDFSFLFLCPVISHITNNTRNATQRAHAFVHIVVSADADTTNRRGRGRHIFSSNSPVTVTSSTNGGRLADGA